LLTRFIKLSPIGIKLFRNLTVADQILLIRTDGAQLAEADPARAIQRFVERLDAEDTATFNELIRMARWAAEQERDAARAALREVGRAGEGLHHVLQRRTYGSAPVLDQPAIPSVDKALRAWRAALDTDAARAALDKGGEA